jgi:hydroxymethylglutaryl-CoA reductase
LQINTKLMTQNKTGFSKLTKEEKINWIATNHFTNPKQAIAVLHQYKNSDESLQKLHDEFIENTLTNFYLPLGVAPNFTINGKNYTIPFAIEESSVVAAASKAAKFWGARGGFKTTILGTEKIGQVHFIYEGDKQKLTEYFHFVKPFLLSETEGITRNMQKRGGGISDIQLVDKSEALENYYQLHATFQTKDSMGANFINSCLEQFAKTFKNKSEEFGINTIQIVMSILSNFVPNCVVRAEVSCPVSELNEDKNITSSEFAEKFLTAVKIAEVEPYRAVTHNKGIMNGIDAVVLATGNDFRAVEAGVHAYASKDGKYTSLSHAKIENGIFTFWLDVPLALGTVGGLTNLHPLVKFSLEMLGNPSATELMEIVAVAGLAQNFAALRSLTTSGIQQGHMKMHLNNILNQHQATKEEKQVVIAHFENQTASHNLVVDFLESLRTK